MGDLLLAKEHRLRYDYYGRLGVSWGLGIGDLFRPSYHAVEQLSLMMDGTQTPLQQLTMQVSKEFHLQMRDYVETILTPL